MISSKLKVAKLLLVSFVHLRMLGTGRQPTNQPTSKRTYTHTHKRERKKKRKEKTNPSAYVQCLHSIWKDAPFGHSCNLGNESRSQKVVGTWISQQRWSCINSIQENAKVFAKLQPSPSIQLCQVTDKVIIQTLMILSRQKIKCTFQVHMSKPLKALCAYLFRVCCSHKIWIWSSLNSDQ